MRRISIATSACALVIAATTVVVSGASAQPAPTAPPPPPPPPASSSATPPSTGAPPIPSAPPSGSSAPPVVAPPGTAPTSAPVTTPPPPNALPPPGTPPPGANPSYPPPGTNPNYPPPGTNPNYPPPGANPNYPPGPYPPGPQPPPYGQGYGYGYGQAGPGVGPAPPPAPKEPSCCRVAFRFDPFDLIFRRLSFQSELVIWGPISVELEPTWIWGSEREFVDASGFALAGNVGVYFSGRALQGFFIKASAGFETFEAVVTHPTLPDTSVARRIGSPIFGGILGSSTVFGRDGGFNISGGIGIGVATAGEQSITVPGGPSPAVTASFYGKASAIQLLGSLGLGGAF